MKVMPKGVGRVSSSAGLLFWSMGMGMLLLGVPNRSSARLFWGGIGTAGVLLALPHLGGILLGLNLLLSVGFVVALWDALLFQPEPVRHRLVVWGRRVGIAAGSVWVLLLGLEASLRTYNWLARPASGGARSRLLPMPPEWAWRRTKVPGAELAYYWQGILHAQDLMGFRRTVPLAPKVPGTCRILVVGDSFTFGEGVDFSRIYTSLMQEELGRDYGRVTDWPAPSRNF